MKSTKRILISLAVAAMAVAGAQAATLDTDFVSTDNKVFSTEHVIWVDPVGAALTLTYENGVLGSPGYIGDTGAATSAKLLATGKWVKDPATGRLYNVKQAHTVLYSNGGTTLYFLGTSALPIADPGAVIYNQIKANSN